MNAPDKINQDLRSLWRVDPAAAFERAVQTATFKLSSRSTRALPDGHNLRPNTLHVYKTMFGKFLGQLRVHFLDARPGDVGRFMDSGNSEVTRATKWRYLRLLERTYDHLVDGGIVQLNPVTAWVLEQRHGGNPVKRGKEGKRPDHAPPDVVERLHDWLHTKGRAALEEGNWRLARDLALSSLSLGTGMRSSELRKLELKQVKHLPGSDASSRFDFHIPAHASVSTVKEHAAVANAACADLFEAWWQYRIREGRAGRMKKSAELNPRDLVFPANLDGKELDPSTVYKSLNRLAALAIADGILVKGQTDWLLKRGAQGLRRAYTLSELTAGAGEEKLKVQLGMWEVRSVERYTEELFQYQIRSRRRPGPKP